MNPPSDPANNEPPSAELDIRHDAYAALRSRPFQLYTIGSFFRIVGSQTIEVAIGWQIFSLTHSATALGLVGLAAALPIIVLALHAGHLADRVNRKHIVMVALAIMAASSFCLAILSYEGLHVPGGAWSEAANHLLLRTAHFFGEKDVTFASPLIPLMFLLLLVSGVAQAFSTPARAAILPQIVPMRIFTNAVTWSSSTFQISSMIGPAMGGLLIGLFHGRPYQYSIVYAFDMLCGLITFTTLAIIPYTHQARAGEGMGLKSLGAGLKFVFEKKIILATITLDLFAVLLGGATALLPMFAKDILLVGPTGLGWLRAAPSIGAFTTGMVLAHRPPMKKAGMALIWAVVGFGAATIVFGLSHWFWLSLLALALTGMFDNISVVIRHTLVQVLAPDEMRGRVSAVNNVFIGMSNELGALESGLTAAAFGPVISVVGGGIGTILVVALVAMAWPEVRKFGSLADVKRG